MSSIFSAKPLYTKAFTEENSTMGRKNIKEVEKVEEVIAAPESDVAAVEEIEALFDSDLDSLRDD